jgi:hypothetical protein
MQIPGVFGISHGARPCSTEIPFRTGRSVDSGIASRNRTETPLTWDASSLSVGLLQPKRRSWPTRCGPELCDDTLPGADTEPRRASGQDG